MNPWSKKSRRALWPVIGLLALLAAARAQEGPGPLLMPMPAKLQMGAGKFLVNKDFKIALRGPEDQRLQDGRMKRAAERFRTGLARITGIPLPSSLEGGPESNFIIHWTGPG